jgi:hypothetical protein
MNRWLQSFASFCDSAASGLSKCCKTSSSSNNFQAGIKVFNEQKSQQPKAETMQATRHSDSESAHIQYFQPAYSFESAGLENNTKQSCYSKSPLSPGERMPLAVHAQPFEFPRPSKDGYAVTVDHGANYARDAGVSDDLGQNVIGGGGDGKLAIHRAARRGTVGLLRFILRYCQRGTTATHTSHLPTCTQRV